jgi:hypothetical protein
VYRHIIDDVVTRVRTDFVQEGVDECVPLHSLLCPMLASAWFENASVCSVCPQASEAASCLHLFSTPADRMPSDADADAGLCWTS